MVVDWSGWVVGGERGGGQFETGQAYLLNIIKINIILLDNEIAILLDKFLEEALKKKEKDKIRILIKIDVTQSIIQYKSYKQQKRK